MRHSQANRRRPRLAKLAKMKASRFWNRTESANRAPEEQVSPRQGPAVPMRTISIGNCTLAKTLLTCLVFSACTGTDSSDFIFDLESTPEDAGQDQTANSLPLDAGFFSTVNPLSTGAVSASDAGPSTSPCVNSESPGPCMRTSAEQLAPEASSVERCAANPCQNGGICSDDDGSLVCECSLGYAGLLCDTAVPTCAEQPCQNEGRCRDRPPEILCECATGFRGARCEVRTNDCQPDLCRNGGTCIGEPSGSRCECSGTGFSGPTCQQPNPLTDGSACTEGRECESAQCDTFFEDMDGDGFAPANAEAERLCTGPGLPTVFTRTRPVGTNIDCTDFDSRANPNATEARVEQVEGGGNFDFNCDGTSEKKTEFFDLLNCETQPALVGCNLVATGLDPDLPEVECGQRGPALICIEDALGNCVAAAAEQSLQQRCL